MKKLLFCFCLLNAACSFAQLDKVAPMLCMPQDASRLENINLLVNTRDFTSTFNGLQPDKFPTSVQLVRAKKPFPPIWYQLGLKKLGPGLTGADFYLGPIINEKTGRLSFSFVIMPDSLPGRGLEGFVVLDTTTMEPVDTLTGADFSFDSIYQPIDNHEYEEDAHGNRLFFSNVKTRMDIRCLSGNPADTLVTAIVQYIVVLDSANAIKMLWNPLQHLSPCEMHWEFRNGSTNYANALNWSHGNSLRWANDGNILYSFRHIGIGKINSETGEIMFKLGGKDSVNAIPLPDSIGYSMQHDFYQRPDGKYSVFSNGFEAYLPYMEGVVYDIDEVHKTVALAGRFRPHPDCISRALGGLDTYNGMYFLNRGMHFCASYNQVINIVDIADHSTVADIYGPQMNFSYRAHPTAWNISRRPSITVQGMLLMTDSIAGLDHYTWYKVDDTSAVAVGYGLSCTPLANGRYVVEARAGTGSFTSYLLADPVDFTVTAVPPQPSKSILLQYDSSRHIAFIDIEEPNGMLKIYNIGGQLVQQASLHKSSNAVSTSLIPGVYVFDIRTASGQASEKVLIH
jgi:hypothetical protein